MAKLPVLQVLFVMQNTVNQNKQTRIILLQSTASYLFRFGNYCGNGLVTEILLYLAISCFLTKQKIRVIQFILNELRFVRYVSLLPVSDVITHMARHTFATLALNKGVSLESVSKILGHTNIRTTMIYANVTSQKIELEMKKMRNK